MPRTDPDFMLGDLPVQGDLILAPMDGYSDIPFRTLCRRFGSSMSYTGFVNAIALVQGDEQAWQELDFLPEERPVVFQIFDQSEDNLLDAALRIQELQPDAIDINMGCSSRKVSSRGAGAGLLRDPEKIARIMHRLADALEVPVTAKIRLGWDQDSLNYLEVAHAVENNGGSLIAVHARTRDQAYLGEADWDKIAEIKSAVTIPVLGNGDVQTPEDIERLKITTGCDGVMIGRGAIGNPWIFQRVAATTPLLDERIQVMREHLDHMISYHGERLGIIRFRKHLKRYLEPLELTKAAIRPLVTCDDRQELETLLSSLNADASP
jgi:nifR3 family TIM-barrel protein